jgi:uncharacterized phiE125 gp8 family phage protein
MGIRVTEPPAVEPVSVADIKTRLRIDHDTEDGLLARLAAAAREAVEAYSGRALVVRRVAETRDAWPFRNVFALTLAPVSSVIGVRVIDAAGAAQALEAAAFTVETDRDETRLALNTAPPSPERRVGGIEIDYRAGYGTEPGAVPAALREAVLVTAAALYGAGEAPAAFPEAARALAASFIRLRT